MKTFPPHPETMAVMRANPSAFSRRMHEVEQGETELAEYMASLPPASIIALMKKVEDISLAASVEDPDVDGEKSHDMAIIALCTLEGMRRALAGVAQRAMDEEK